MRTSRTKDQRPTLGASGAPLAGLAPLREMPLVLLKSAARFRTRSLRKLGREQGVEAELGR